MSESPTIPAPRRKRQSVKAQAAYRQFTFEAMMAGWRVEQIAEMRKVSRRTIRREIDSALDERRLDAPDRYVKMQVARFTKAIRAIDIAMDKGDMRAVFALVKVAGALDRYHGVGEPVRRAVFAPVEPRLSRPPLALPVAEAMTAEPLPFNPESASPAEPNPDAHAGRGGAFRDAAPVLPTAPCDGPGDARAASRFVTDYRAQMLENTGSAPDPQKSDAAAPKHAKAGSPDEPPPVPTHETSRRPDREWRPEASAPKGSPAAAASSDDHKTHVNQLEPSERDIAFVTLCTLQAIEKLGSAPHPGMSVGGRAPAPARTGHGLSSQLPDGAAA